MQPLLLGILRILSTSVVASCIQSPLAWSPDGQWLAFTMTAAEPLGLPIGGLIDEAAMAGRRIDARTPGARPSAAAPRNRIWATERATGLSVLIEESPHPLTAPCWGPDGRTLCYGRLALGPAAEPRGGPVTGHYELIVQEALDRKRVIATIPGIEPGSVDLDSIARLQGVFSPDGQYLAVPMPGPSPSILIVLPEQGRVLKTIEHAEQPAWSPDASRMAFLRLPRAAGAGRTLQVIGRDFGAGKSLIELSEPCEAPIWSPDGQSVLLAGRRTLLRGRESELIRVFVDSGVATRVLPLGGAPPDPRAANRGLLLEPKDHKEVVRGGIAIGFDRAQEQCVFSADLDGQVPALVFGNPRRQVILKRFHPLDISLRLGALAVHPDGQVVAVRVQTSDRSAPPLLCDLGTESVTLLAPDAHTRREWLGALAITARGLLQGALPQASVDGHPIDRATLLPVSGEIADQNPVAVRLRRLGKVGRNLMDQPPGEPSSALGEEPGPDRSDEFRLFFDYLRGDYAVAEADLDAIASRSELPESRFRLLAVRAQILQAKGQRDLARPIVDYLLQKERASQRVEETPAGLVLSRTDDGQNLWPRYLAQRLAVEPTTASAPPEEDEDGIDLRMPPMMDGFPAGPIDGGARILTPPRDRGLGGQPRRPGFPDFGRGSPRPAGPVLDPVRAPRPFPPPPPPRPRAPLSPPNLDLPAPPPAPR